MHEEEIFAERFEIARMAGSGGMGQVYQARDRRSGEVVALKVLFGSPEQGAERFAREAETLAALRHPGIVRYIAHGTTGAGLPYLAMEWLEGLTLAERLAKDQVTIAESVTLATRVAATLGEVHRRGFVHRDIKPSNIFLRD